MQFVRRALRCTILSIRRSKEEGAESPPVYGHGRGPAPTGRFLFTLSPATLGVVYGGTGTSPLYAIREAFGHAYGIAPSQANVRGVLSLIFWALIAVISIKSLLFVMRADNRGEGGMIALAARRCCTATA